MVEEESTLFNLTAIRGPYYVKLNLDNDANGDKETLEVHFCNPVRQNGLSVKKSLVYLRNTSTPNYQLMRAARLTSGESSFSSTNVLRNDNSDICGINLVAQDSVDYSKSAFCKDNTRWTVSFNVLCSATETGLLSYDKFSLTKNSDACTLEFTAIHKAGCGTPQSWFSKLKPFGLIQYLNFNSNFNPWFVALILIAAGIVTCFFGG
jgi:hypothetical protein